MMVTERQLSSQKIIKALKFTRTRSAVKIVLLTLYACVLFTACGRTEAPESAFRTVRSIAGPESGIGEPFDVAVRGNDIYVSDGLNGKIFKITDGVVSEVASGLNTPSGIDFAQDGSLIVVDSGAKELVLIRPSGELSSINPTARLATTSTKSRTKRGSPG